MHTLSVLLSTAACATMVAADFYIYRGIQYITVDGSSADGFYFFSGPPSCDDVYGAVPKTVRDDVSGSKYGVRCEGCSTGEGGDVAVTVLEFNNADFGHYTFYAENNELVDLDNKVVGSCTVDGSDDYDCFDGLGTYKGISQIACTTDLGIP